MLPNPLGSFLHATYEGHLVQNSEELVQLWARTQPSASCWDFTSASSPYWEIHSCNGKNPNFAKLQDIVLSSEKVTFPRGVSFEAPQPHTTLTHTHTRGYIYIYIVYIYLSICLFMYLYHLYLFNDIYLYVFMYLFIVLSIDLFIYCIYLIIDSFYLYIYVYINKYTIYLCIAVPTINISKYMQIWVHYQAEQNLCPQSVQPAIPTFFVVWKPPNCSKEAQNTLSLPWKVLRLAIETSAHFRIDTHCARGFSRSFGQVALSCSGDRVVPGSVWMSTASGTKEPNSRSNAYTKMIWTKLIKMCGAKLFHIVHDLSSFP